MKFTPYMQTSTAILLSFYENSHFPLQVTHAHELKLRFANYFSARNTNDNQTSMRFFVVNFKILFNNLESVS